MRIKSLFFIRNQMLKTVVLVGFLFFGGNFLGILKRRVGHSQAINTAKFCSGLNVTHRFSHRFSQSPNFPNSCRTGRKIRRHISIPCCPLSSRYLRCVRGQPSGVSCANRRCRGLPGWNLSAILGQGRGGYWVRPPVTMIFSKVTLSRLRLSA